MYLEAAEPQFATKSKKAQRRKIPRLPLDKFGNIIGSPIKCVAETETPRERPKYVRKKRK